LFGGRDQMISKDVISFYNQLKQLGVTIWIDGGWGVDAQLGEQTRLHRDLDIAVQLKDLSQLFELLSEQDFKDIARDDSSPHNFVMGDEQGREVDIHVIVLDHTGNGIYGPI